MRLEPARFDELVAFDASSHFGQANRRVVRHLHQEIVEALGFAIVDEDEQIVGYLGIRPVATPDPRFPHVGELWGLFGEGAYQQPVAFGRLLLRQGPELRHVLGVSRLTCKVELGTPVTDTMRRLLKRGGAHLIEVPGPKEPPPRYFVYARDYPP